MFIFIISGEGMLSSFNGYDESKVFLRFSEISEYPGSKDCVYLEKYLVNIDVNIIIDKKNLLYLFHL